MKNFTPQEQLEYCKRQRNNAYNNMEGEDAEGFAKWERLFCAWQTIVDEMQKELNDISGSNKTT